LTHSGEVALEEVIDLCRLHDKDCRLYTAHEYVEFLLLAALSPPFFKYALTLRAFVCSHPVTNSIEQIPLHWVWSLNTHTTVSLKICG
jgi:hypothetical protein